MGRRLGALADAAQAGHAVLWRRLLRLQLPLRIPMHEMLEG